MDVKFLATIIWLIVSLIKIKIISLGYQSPPQITNIQTLHMAMKICAAVDSHPNHRVYTIMENKVTATHYVDCQS